MGEENNQGKKGFWWRKKGFWWPLSAIPLTKTRKKHVVVVYCVLLFLLLLYPPFIVTRLNMRMKFESHATLNDVRWPIGEHREWHFFFRPWDLSSKNRHSNFLLHGPIVNEGRRKKMKVDIPILALEMVMASLLCGAAFVLVKK